MEGFFINKQSAGQTALSSSLPDSKLALLGRGPGIEVMRQTIRPDAIVWITPAEDKETMEFFYIMSGSLTLMPDTEAIRLSAGDSFYTLGLGDDVLIKVHEDTQLLYVTNRPLFEDALSFQGDLESLMRRVDDKDNYTYEHSRNVMSYSLLLFRKLCPGVPYNDVTTAALFHDVGKCLLPDEILKKPGKLTFNEFRQIMKHAIYSARLLQNRFGERVAEIARSHHERLDGSGYPFGLSGDEISLEGRIIAVADSFDAMTSKRVYRDHEKSYLEAAEELCSLPNLYDARVTAALRDMVISGELERIKEEQKHEGSR